MSTSLTRPLAVLAGAVAGLAVAAIASAVTDGIQVSGADLPLWQVAAAAITAGLLGWLAAVVAERRFATPRRTWTVGAAAVAAVSLAGPLAMPGIATADRFWLVLVHLAVATAYIAVMVRTLPATATSSARRPVRATAR